MGTVPTGKLERELRKLYLQWLAGVPKHQDDLNSYINTFEAKSTALIGKLGGQTASLGALADFPTPKLLELSPRADVVYDEMKQAAIQAGLAAGLQSTDIARQMLNAGLDKSFRKLNRLARTETVSAYWKNQWDSVADLPAIVMVWGAERGSRTCDYCISRDGLVVEDPNIRDHPNGRCTLIPTLRSQVKYKGTLQPDGSVTMDPRWTEQKVKGAKAQESAGPTTAEQRDPMSGKTNPAAPSQAQPTHRSAIEGKDARIMTNEDKIEAAKTMYGSNSKQYKEALERWGTATPGPNVKVTTGAPETWAKKKTPKYVVDDLAQKSMDIDMDYMDVLNQYTNEGAFSPVNASLRGVARKDSAFDEFFAGEGDEDNLGYMKMFIKDMDDAIAGQRTMSEMTLYRGVESGALPADIKRGAVITDNGYMSTTVKPEVAQDFSSGGDIIRITYPAGHPALYIDAIEDVNLNQGEVLLPRGLNLKVASIQVVNNRRIINVTVQ